MNNNKKILVVDDENLLREIISFDLTRKGYQVLEAGSGDEGLAVVQNQQVDLVISDVRMPSGTGIQLLDNLRAINPERPPFLFMTAFSDLSSEEAFDLGAEMFLRKPVEKDELLKTVEQALVPKPDRWASHPSYIDGSRTMIWESLDASLDRAVQTHITIEAGQGGIFVNISEGLPSPLELINFKIGLKGHPLCGVAGTAHVRWIRHTPQDGYLTGLGLEFLGLDESSREIVRGFLGRHKPKAFIPLGRATNNHSS
ncbi:MAG: response regulator [Oligoflexales bacterium]